jgi:pimeloyl-ACP methyl ester carboxylesterase
MESVTSRDGTEIAFDRHGEGSPVVLVGGAFQHRDIDPPTAQLASLLGERFSVYHYDRRGRGDSGDAEAYSPEREIEDLEALIDLAGGPASVFGNSSGAVLALDAAASGLAIERLTLYEPPFIVDDSRPPVPEDYREQLVKLISAGRRDEAVGLFLTGPAEVPAEFVAQMRNAPIWPAFESVAHTLAYDAAFVEGTQGGWPLPAGRWDSVTMPTLVLDGGASPTWVRNAALAIAGLLPDARRSTLEGQTHEVDPEVLAPVLKDFFAVGDRE